MKLTKFALSTLSLLASFSVMAKPIQHVIVTPTCLLKNISAKYQTLSTNDKFSLITVNEAGLDQLIDAKAHRQATCGGFMNVTDAWNTQKSTASDFLNKYTMKPVTFKNANKTSYSINHPKEVNQLIGMLNPQNMWTNLTKFSSFHDRYAGSDTGDQAAQWLNDQVTKMAQGRTDVKIYFVKTNLLFKQSSLVMKVGDSNEPGIVIGGHMDTLKARSATSNMPGADDDGTGTVTVLEAARTILSSNMHFKKPIYFVWYSAEELGLIGSQHVVRDFKNQQIPVSEVLQFDMTGYTDPTSTTPNAMWLMQDYTDPTLTSYLANLITTYVKQTVKYSSCGYACSDHATWYQNGYNSAIAFETEMDKYDPYIHSPNDTMSQVSLGHMTDFAKLSIAFAVELAEPVA